MRKIVILLIFIAVLGIVLFIVFNQRTPQVLTPDGAEVILPDDSLSPTSAIIKQGALKDVSGGVGKGIAKVTYENGRFFHEVIASMPNPAEGKFYEGWLVHIENGQVINFFSTGKMVKAEEVYILEFESEQDYSNHNNVVITLEEVDDQQPEAHILEGKFGLVIELLQEGTGREAKNGDTVFVHYTGTFENGEKFDSSLDRGSPFDFELGAGRVIPGWDLGVLGMKTGEKRMLKIAPELAYGESGSGNVIPPNATLIFTVELLEIR